MLKGRRAGVPREHFEQVALFIWADSAGARAKHPELEMLFAVPNGGHRHKATAGKLKAEGVRRGVPDLMLDVSRGGFHGFRGELKAEGGAMSIDQRAWRDRYKAHGYYHVVAVGWEAMRDEILGYLELRATT